MNSADSQRSGTKTKWIIVAVIAVLAGGGAAYRIVRGPSGATELHGGSLEAKAMPALPADAARWVNGEPVALASPSPQVLFVEGWHPA